MDVSGLLWLFYWGGQGRRWPLCLFSGDEVDICGSMHALLRARQLALHT